MKKTIEVIVLIEIVDGAATTRIFPVPENEPQRQELVETVEAEFAQIVRDVSGEEFTEEEMYDLTGEARYDYNNCSVQFTWDTITL